MRIAVTTGEALVRLDARPEAGEGMASGDVVNTAARLQNAAPVNGILADETTYRATRQVIGYEEATAVEAKGKAEPIPVWEALRVRARASASTSRTRRAASSSAASASSRSSATPSNARDTSERHSS